MNKKFKTIIFLKVSLYSYSALTSAQFAAVLETVSCIWVECAYSAIRILLLSCGKTEKK